MKATSYLRRVLPGMACASAVCALLASPAGAVEIPSNETGGGNWTDPATWVGGDIPDNSVPNEDALVKQGDTVTIDADQTARHLFVGDDATTLPGIVTMTGGTLTLEAIYIGTDLDLAGAGATPGNGVLNFIDGTIILAETGNDTGATGANSIDQALEISAGPGSTGVMTMGDGTTNPTLTYSGGRFEVGGHPAWTTLPAVGHNATFNFQSGTITGTGQNLIIGQNNRNDGTAVMTVGGFATPASFTTSNDLNLNRPATLTLNSNGSVEGRDLQYATNGTATTTVNVNAGGTLTVNRDMNDRAGISILNITGGSVVFTDGTNSGQAAVTAGREREVENLTMDGGNLTFSIDGDETNGIMPISVAGDDPISSTLSGDITVTPVISQSDPANNGNTTTLVAWDGLNGNWDTTAPNGANWDGGFAPEDAGAISVGQSFLVLAYSPLINPGTGGLEFPFGGGDNLINGNDDLEFDVFDLTSFTSTDGDWSTTTIDADADDYPEAYSIVRQNTAAKTSPATALFDQFDVVTVGNAADSTANLVIGRYVGADAGGLLIDDIETLTVNHDLIIGGVEEGIVTHGTSVPAISGVAVVVSGDLIFGNDGTWDASLATPQPQGGTYNLNDGTLSVVGDIVEGEPGLPDADVDNAQFLINTGTTAANALTVGGTVTVQRFAVGSAVLSNAGLTISTAAGLETVTSSGTTSIGVGADNAEDGDPGTVAGAQGEVIVEGGGSLTCLSLNIAEDGDSVGILTINSGGTVVSNGRIYVGGDENNADDAESNGTLTVNAGGSLTVVTGNTEIGRDGIGLLTVDGGTYIQEQSNLVLSQDGNNDANNSGMGDAVFSNGAVVTIGVDTGNGGAATSTLNINEGGGTIVQTGNSTVTVELDLNFSDTPAASSLPGDSSYTIDSGSLTIGDDLNFRGGVPQNDLLISGTASIFVGATGDVDDTIAGSDFILNGGAADSNLVSLTGSTCTLDIWDDIRADASSRFKWVGDAGGVSTIRMGLNPVGDIADTTADRVGVIALNNAVLELDLSSVPAPPGLPAPNLVLIENGDIAATTAVGTFAGLPEGANISGTVYAITYAGGDGNDVELIVSPDPDVDGDGMPKSYEDANGLSDSDPSDAGSDNDMDRFDALFEYLVGTSASDSTSRPVLTIDWVSPTQVDITYGPIVEGVTYVVTSSTDVASFDTTVDTFTAGALDVAASRVIVDATGGEVVEAFRVEVAAGP